MISFISDLVVDIFVEANCVIVVIVVAFVMKSE